MEDETKEEIQEPKEEEMAAVDPNEEKETPAEEKAETPEQEKKEEEAGEEKEMSLDAYLDVAVTQKFLEDETEIDEEFVMEFSKEDKKQVNWALVAKKMFAVCQKMSMKSKEFCGKFAEAELKEKAYMAENAELKQFKSDIQSGQFKFEVDATLKEIENSVSMPREVMESLREESVKFSVDTVDAWKNLARAKAFEYTSKTNKKDSVVRYAINNSPFVGTKQGSDNGSPWKIN